MPSLAMDIKVKPVRSDHPIFEIYHIHPKATTMPRKPKPDVMENEAKMLQAIAAYRNKEYKHISAAAAAFGVSRTTLNNRINGRCFTSRKSSTIPGPGPY